MSTTTTNKTSHKPSSDPGYLMTVPHGGSEYQVFIYIRDAQGNKTYLPSDSNSETIDKIRGLTSGLLNAHDARRISARENSYALSGINSRGLIKKNNTLISHDFLIQPVSVLVADQMASAVSSPGNPIDASAIKAKDVWTALEGTFRREMGRPSNPAPVEAEQPSQQISKPDEPVEPPQTAQQPTQQAPVTQTTPPVQQTSTQTPPSPPAPKPQAQPPKSNPPLKPDNLLVLHGPEVTASELNLRGYDFNRPDWYEKMPERIKLRVITDILALHCHQGGIYEKVWKIFETRANKDPTLTTIGLLEDEQQQLSLRCRTLPSAIPLPIRLEANQIIEAYHEHLNELALQEKIVTLVEKEIALKEELFQCIREQAMAEGVAIEDWDRHWAQHHCLESTNRFIQALARWLDTN